MICSKEKSHSNNKSVCVYKNDNKITTLYNNGDRGGRGLEKEFYYIYVSCYLYAGQKDMIGQNSGFLEPSIFR